MGCGSREKGNVEQHAKWDYINLDDFHATSSWTPFSYLWVWIFAFIGVACFGLDCFTAVNLLILDKWASGIEPTIPLNFSKWIFVGCIMFSFLLYAYEWIIAIRLIRRGGVAESYMDPLTAQLQCMRKKGWKRFLVFAELTKSRKGADYVALFVHFQFDNFLRIVFAEGGRSVVNAVTIWSFTQKNLAVTDKHPVLDGTSPIIQFFKNIGNLWQTQTQQALILSSMAFTFVIWAFWALCLIVALILYLVFLWHYIPQVDGRLSVYCRRKIDRRLEKIVEKKLQAAFKEQERQLQRAETFGTLKSGSGKKSPTVSIQPVRQPTLPNIGDDFDSDAKSLALSRMETSSPGPPPYGSRPGTSQDSIRMGISRQATLPDIAPSASMPPHLQRHGTQFSVQTYNTDASLLHNAGEMGYDSDGDSLHGPRSGSAFGQRGPPPRSMTSSTLGSQRGYGPPPRNMMGPPRSNTAFSSNDDRNPMSRAGSAMAGPMYPPPQRTFTPDSYAINERPSREQTPFSKNANPPYGQAPQQRPLQSRRSFSRPFASDNDQRLLSPATREPTPPMPTMPPSSTPTPVNGGSPGNSGYVAFNPSSFRSPSVPAVTQPRPLQLRSATNPVELQDMDPRSIPRSYTAPINPRRGPSPPHPHNDGGRF